MLPAPADPGEITCWRQRGRGRVRRSGSGVPLACRRCSAPTGHRAAEIHCDRRRACWPATGAIWSTSPPIAIASAARRSWEIVLDGLAISSVLPVGPAPRAACGQHQAHAVARGSDRRRPAVRQPGGSAHPALHLQAHPCIVGGGRKRHTRSRDYSLRVQSVRSNDDCGRLIVAFNDMLGQIGSARCRAAQGARRIGTTKVAARTREPATSNSRLADATRLATESAELAGAAKWRRRANSSPT